MSWMMDSLDSVQYSFIKIDTDPSIKDLTFCNQELRQSHVTQCRSRQKLNAIKKKPPKRLFLDLQISHLYNLLILNALREAEALYSLMAARRL